MRRLIVSADDFGFTRGVNEGILRAHEQGIVTATSLMANAPAFAHAVDIAYCTPSLDVGVHLVLWREGQRLPQRVPSFLRRGLSSSTDEIEEEFSRQVEKIVAAGLTPSHLNTHKHVHLLPHVWRAVARVATRFGILWVRRPLYRRQATARGLRTPDHFLGVRLTGRLNRQRLLKRLERLPTGLNELMCHPGLCDDELRRAPTRLKRERQVELEALTNPEVRRLLERKGIELTSFRALGGTPRKRASR